MKELEEAFAFFWEKTGKEFASETSTTERGTEFLRLLCRIAYCQGRIDEAIREEKVFLAAKEESIMEAAKLKTSLV